MTDEERTELQMLIGDAIWGAVGAAAACSHRPQHVLDQFIDANAAACFAGHVIDGPLTDLEVLVRIPAVRELVEMYLDAGGQFGSDYFWEKHGHREFLGPWAAALEATS